MFTGLVETTGIVSSIRQDRGGMSLSIKASFSREPVVLGESIAVSGICLTVEQIDPDGFKVFASSETMATTTIGALKRNDLVNLERAMPADGRFGGHIVAGYVDGVGRIQSITAQGASSKVAIEVPVELMKYLAAKGSVAVDGISLTINKVTRNTFEVMIIPHTFANTTLATLKSGAKVNIEVDIIARYLEALVSRASGSQLAAKMRSVGFAIDD
jgi:riboflavin synthase